MNMWPYVANGASQMSIWILTLGNHPGLPRWAQGHHKGSYRREGGNQERLQQQNHFAQLALKVKQELSNEGMRWTIEAGKGRKTILPEASRRYSSFQPLGRRFMTMITTREHMCLVLSHSICVTLPQKPEESLYSYLAPPHSPACLSGPGWGSCGRLGFYF